MNSYFVLSFVLSFFALSNGAQLPPYIKACKIREANYKECVIKNGNDAIPAIIKGDKKYNIPPLNPLILPSVTLDGIGGLQLNATNVKVNGLSAAKLIDAGIDLEKRHVFFQLMVPLIDLDFNYNVAGKLVSLSIEGNGHGKIDIVNGKFLYNFDFNVVENGGKRILQIAKEDFLVDPEKLTFNLENLFNGDQKLGEQVNKFLNENWKEVLSEAGPALTKVIGAIVGSLVGNILNNTPVEDIFLDF